MDSGKRDKSIIEHILEHIDDIQNAQKRFGGFQTFVSDKDYFKSVCLSLLQIGELSHHLTPEFTTAHNDIPWKQIVALRNIVVHGYERLKPSLVWSAVTDDIPKLRRKCTAIIESPETHNNGARE
jgi:uncharacterized protein with HEPN domain